MNATFHPRSLRWLTLFALGVCCVPLFAVSVSAAELPILQANAVYEFASDRARMIQISVVFVAIGCAVMWWYK